MMAAFGLTESGRVVNAAAGIMAALGFCKFGEANDFLRDALDVLAQLGENSHELTLRAGALLRVASAWSGGNMEAGGE